MGYESIEYELNEEYISRLYEEYGDRFEDIKKVYPNFRKDQEVRLGVLLENVNTEIAKRVGKMNKMMNLNEATQTTHVADGIKTQYFDIITAVWPNLIAEQLFSVQPIRSKTAQIFYLKYVYGTDKGKVKKGDTIFSSTEIAGYENRNYTSEIVEEEATFKQEDAGTEMVFEGNLEFVPVRPGTVVFTMDTTEIKDDGMGALKGTGITGTIDYETGAYKVTFTTAPSAGDAYADYEYDLSYAPSTIPAIELRVTDTTVTARPRKLKGVYSLDAGYDLKMSQGIDIDDSLLEAAAEVLKNETDAELIMTAYRQAAMTITWNNTYNNQKAGLSKKEFYEDFIDCIVRGSSMIKKKTKRVSGNWIVTGKTGSDVLTFIGAPRFVASGDTTSVGPRFIGTLDGKWKVFDDPFLNDDDFLIGYKGNNLMDAGLIYAPYLLFFATETVMLEDFLGRRGFATTYGKKMVNANMYVRGRITRSTTAGDNTTIEDQNGTPLE